MIKIFSLFFPCRINLKHFNGITKQFLISEYHTFSTKVRTIKGVTPLSLYFWIFLASYLAVQHLYELWFSFLILFSASPLYNLQLFISTQSSRCCPFQWCSSASNSNSYELDIEGGTQGVHLCIKVIWIFKAGKIKVRKRKTFGFHKLEKKLIKQRNS